MFNLQNKSRERQAPGFTVIEDPVEALPARLQKKLNTDSGYHGLSDDDMDVDRPRPATDPVGIAKNAQKSPARLLDPTSDRSEDRSTAEPSFHSAREENTKTHILETVPQNLEPATAPYISNTLSTEGHPEPMAIDQEISGRDVEDESVADESRSPSRGSSPAKSLVRKSSLTFAALPPRPPMTTKKSLGTNTARTSHLDQNNFMGHFTGGKSLGGSKQSESTGEEREEMLLDQGLEEKPALVREESDTDAKMRRLHNKSTTQLLHEKINLLGKSQATRPTKSIPAVAPATQATYPQLPDPEAELQQSLKVVAQQSNGEDDDDWIQPPNPVSEPDTRPPLTKSISTDVMEDIRGKHTVGGKEFNIENLQRSASKTELPMPYAGKVDSLRTASDSRAASPGIYSAYDGVKTFEESKKVERSHGHPFGLSTTPIGSPTSKRYVDGPLSASKSKLQSIMKTAKSLFSSSAGVSAQAKMNMLSPLDQHSPESSNWAVLGDNDVDVVQHQALQTSKEDRSRPKTRSSAEKAERLKKTAGDRGVVEREYVEAIEPNRLKAPMREDVGQAVKSSKSVQPPAKPTRTSPRRPQIQEAPEVPERTTSKKALPHEGAGLPRHNEQSSSSTTRPALQGQRQSSQTQRAKDPRRPIKPAKDAGPKPKPQPLEIRVGMPSTKRLPLTNSALSTGLQESLKSSVNGTTKPPKSLIAAERKKEQVSIRCDFSLQKVR